MYLGYIHHTKLKAKTIIHNNVGIIFSPALLMIIPEMYGSAAPPHPPIATARPTPLIWSFCGRFCMATILEFGDRGPIKKPAKNRVMYIKM